MALHPGATSGSAPVRKALLLASLVLVCHVSLTAGSPSIAVAATNSSSSFVSRLRSIFDIFIARPSFYRRILSDSVIWDMVALSAACGLLVFFKCADRHYGGKSTPAQPESEKCKAAPTDPGLLKKHSTQEAYRTDHANYPSIRTFYHPHPQAEKLPKKPKPLPLLIFVHGLGGSLAQFNPLLTGLVNVAPCFGIDLPGCGLSDFAPHDWKAYSHAALVDLLEVVVQRALDRAEAEEAVLVCHSMGCSLAASLLNKSTREKPSPRDKVVGIIAVCPKVSLPTADQVRGMQRILQIPTPLFDLWRRWDRKGGVNSTSVVRMIGSDASIESKKLQLRFNEQSRTAVWRRMAWGATPAIRADGSLSNGLPGPEVWSRISIPLFAVAGEADKVTEAEEIAIITKTLARKTPPVGEGPVIPDTTGETAPQAKLLLPNGSPNTMASHKTPMAQSDMDVPLIDKEHSHHVEQFQAGPEPKKAVLKTTTLPSPAAHGLLYDNATYRTLSGLIQTFLADHIDNRLSLGWQLQHLKESNKWDVKNLAKWKAMQPVSEPIADIFRAMKTLREVDEVHSPSNFTDQWGDKIKAVIDISHESPVYSPEGLEAGGVQYHKFPTVSKIPPTPEECTEFIALVDQLRSEEQADATGAEAASSDGKEKEHGAKRAIGVHCHYGFNRTGFFICSYLIERERFGVQQAIDEFARRRPPGIRHEHFLDTLFVRYCVGLKGAPTL